MDDDSIADTVVQLSEALAALMKDPSEAAAKHLLSVVMHTGAMSIVQVNSELLVHSEGIKTLVMALQEVRVGSFPFPHFTR